MSGGRASALSPPEFLLLEHWGRTLRASFGHTPYLVGSCERGESFRDVDVRMILPDDEYAALCGDHPQRLAIFNMTISHWGQRVTGLPIDFSFQEMTHANEKYNDRRNPLGVRSGIETLEVIPAAEEVQR